jgi:hypothetical protein
MPIFASLSQKNKEKTNILTLSNEGALLNNIWSLWKQSIRWCWYESTTFRKLALLPSSRMKLSLLGPLVTRQYRNISSDGANNSFRTFTLWQKLWLLTKTYEEMENGRYRCPLIECTGNKFVLQQSRMLKATSLPAQIAEYKLVNSKPR